MTVQGILLKGLEVREARSREEDLGWHGRELERGKRQGSHTTRFVKINHSSLRVKN